jgi:hypothetical protein
MSEDFLSQIADELRGQQIPNATETVEVPAEEQPAAEPVVPETEVTAQVNDQITDAVTQTKEWWDEDEKPVAKKKRPVPSKKAKVEEDEEEYDEDLLKELDSDDED